MCYIISVAVPRDIIDKGPYGGQFLRFFIADLQVEFFFERHECFKDIERIKAEIVREGRVVDQGRFFHA